MSMSGAPDAVMADAQWGGGSDVMNAFETLMWRVEIDSPLRSTCVAVELLDGTPDWSEVVAVHERVVRMVPRLRQRVVAPPMGLAPPRWAQVSDFDLHYHLRRTRLPEGAGWTELLAAAQKAGMRGFDRSRPQWEAVLYEGMPDGKSAYVFKLHHAMSDGLGIMKLMGLIHPPAGTKFPDLPAEFARPARTMTPLDALRAHAGDGVRSAPGLARKAGESTLRAVTSPLSSVKSSASYTRSLRRVLSPPAAKPSPLLAARSNNWRFAALDVDFPSLRKAAKSVGGSINDAYLAALLGGYRLYHEAMGSTPVAIPIAIPISLRSAEDATGGNEIATARLAAPMDIVDPAKRLAAIGDMVRRARSEPAMNNINLVAPTIAKLPPAMIAQLAGGMTKTNDLQASNVPGFRDDVFLAGVRVELLYGYAPLPGCPAMITLLTHGAIGCVGINYDAAAFTDGPLFIRSLVAGFDEVLRLAGTDAVPTTSR
ncbi:MAG: wax ester/triacylglycerol synthase domain-containing protein [Sporichthyaceae bacterium]